ncbi:hypothetical protein ACS0TY_015484 [Phlomoides rotata]
MKQFSHGAIFSVFLLLLISHASSRLISSHQDDSQDAKTYEISQQEADFQTLIGSERCGDKDEECEKRRIVAEAHLDYIYTQPRPPHV